jgi:flagellar protein FlgJ
MAGNAKIGGLGATSGTGDASTWLDIQGVASLREGANARRPDTVKQVAQQFESMFLGMMLKSMRDAKLADSPFDSDESRLYQDMYDKQVTLGLSQGKGLGIAEMLARQLAPEAARPAAVGPAAKHGATTGVSAAAGVPASERAAAAAPRDARVPTGGPFGRVGESRSAPAFDAATVARHEAFRAARRTEASAPRGAVTDVAAMRTPDAAPTATAVPPPVAPQLDGLDAALGGLQGDGDDEYAIDATRLAAMLRGETPGDVDATTDAAGGATAAATNETAPSPGGRPAHAHGARRFAESPEDFVKKVLPHAQAAAAELGVSPAAIVAQAALETGWGRNVPASPTGAGHNLFGIKAGDSWNGARVGRTTLEVASGVPVRMQAAFRAYSSVADGFRDYVNLLSTSGRYGAVRGAGSDPARFAHALQAGGYATDPHYARKILAIVNGSTLREAMAAAGADLRSGQLLALKSDAVPPIT